MHIQKIICIYHIYKYNIINYIGYAGTAMFIRKSLILSNSNSSTINNNNHHKNNNSSNGNGNSKQSKLTSLWKSKDKTINTTTNTTINNTSSSSITDTPITSSTSTSIINTTTTTMITSNTTGTTTTTDTTTTNDTNTTPFLHDSSSIILDKISFDFEDIKKSFHGEGRTITAEFNNFFLVACYVPNSGKNEK